MENEKEKEKGEEKEEEKMSPWRDKRTTRKDRTTQPMDAGRQR